MTRDVIIGSWDMVGYIQMDYKAYFKVKRERDRIGTKKDVGEIERT